tara:strand:+ start:240 stop:500 length:261 start_codon:yes stop_codon:yes gene_type:complete
MDKYTKFILTVIAVAMIGILFKGEKIITSAHAIEKHTHYFADIYGGYNPENNVNTDFQTVVKAIVAKYCGARLLGDYNAIGPIICN